MCARPHQMDAHDQRHRHAQENAEEREPQIKKPYGLVIGAKDIARKEASSWPFWLILAAIVSDHAGRKKNFILGDKTKSRANNRIHRVGKDKGYAWELGGRFGPPEFHSRFVSVA